MQVSIASEVDPLRLVVVHRPGTEVVRMTHGELERLLFDDILAADAAGQEHDVLREILAAEGAEVLDVADLLRRSLTRAPATELQQLLTQVCERAGASQLSPLLAEWPPGKLAAALIQGVSYDELGTAPPSLVRIRDEMHRRATMALPPVPNLMFTRDPCISIFDRVLVGRMATDARAREPLLVHFALRFGLDDAPDFLWAEPDWDRHRAFRSLEGGDVLALSPEVLLIGCSERSAPQTIERVAEEVLFPTFGPLRRVYAVVMPRQRSVMHLDTILTQVDHQLFLGHAPMVQKGRHLAVVRLERGCPPVLVGGREAPATLLDVLRDELGSQTELVPCGGDDQLFQDREQWTDGANAVCLAPGRVVLYSRNVRTIRTLCDRQGFTRVDLSAQQDAAERRARLAAARAHPRVVFTFMGGELSRARGGARCMTMPLTRSAP